MKNTSNPGNACLNRVTMATEFTSLFPTRRRWCAPYLPRGKPVVELKGYWPPWN